VREENKRTGVGKTGTRIDGTSYRERENREVKRKGLKENMCVGE